MNGEIFTISQNLTKCLLKINDFLWKKMFLFFYKFSMGLYLDKIPSVALKTQCHGNAPPKTVIFALPST